MNCHFAMPAKRGLVGCGCAGETKGKESNNVAAWDRESQEGAFQHSGAQSRGAGGK